MINDKKDIDHHNFYKIENIMEKDTAQQQKSRTDTKHNTYILNVSKKKQRTVQLQKKLKMII